MSDADCVKDAWERWCLDNPRCFEESTRFGCFNAGYQVAAAELARVRKLCGEAYDQMADAADRDTPLMKRLLGACEAARREGGER